MKKLYFLLLVFGLCFNWQIFAQQTGFVEAFDEAMVPAGIVQNSKYTFSLNLQALEVNVSRDSRWFGFDYDLGGSYDISANPVINVKLKTETDMILQLFLIDSDGKGYQTALVGSQYKYDELVPDKNEYRSARILKGVDFNTVSFDFSSVNPVILDLKKIAKIKFVSNGTALTFVGKFTIDEFRMGNQAIKMAYIGQLAERNYLKNSTGTKEVLIPEIKNAAELHVSGASLLIANAAVTPITYTTSTENGTSVQYGFAKLTYSLVADAIGSDTITLEAMGVNGFAENSMKFAINVKNNNLPTIDPVADYVVQKDQLNEIKLTGITSGDSEANQTLTLTAISDNTSVVETIHVGYSSPDHYGKISFSSKSAGTAKITLTVADNEGAITNTSFIATSFKSINQPPVIDPVNQLTVTNTSGQQSILLTGIGDGDHSNQTLIISATSSEPAIIPDPTIIFDQGSETATLGFNPTGVAGLANITVTISDNGGNAENDGNKTTNLLIPIEVIVSSPTGLEFDLSASGALSYFKPENLGVAYFIAIVDTLGSKALRVTMKDKWTYAGIWMDLPFELNLSQLPVVSYDVLSVNQATWHWNYFYDAKGQDGGQNRNTQNSGDHQFQAPADSWTTLSFDYRQPGDLNNDGGNPIDASRINALLINMHNAKPTWPFTNATGVLYLRNINFGDKAVYTPEQVYATMNPVASQSAYENGGSQTILLSGISNGKKGIDNITITASSSSENIAAVSSVSPINPDGSAILTYTPLASGSALISIKIEATGAVPVTVNSIVTVLKNDPAGYAKLTIDKTLKYQTMRGFGTFLPDSRFGDLYAGDLGASVVRLGIIGNQWEPENDNEDSNVTNMEGFNYNAFDWNYLRDLKAKGVESFIITSWSPPAWMKRNLSLDHKEQAIEWEKTDNVLESYYYEEFAESMAALVRAMKQEAGIDILAIGLQNEPYFNEPYPSAILGGAQFVQLMKIVGDRFKKEGLSQVGFYMPEQVFGIGWGDYSCEGYLTTLKSDLIADEYCQYFAVHGYDGTGITSGFPTYNHWASMTALAQQGNHPKESWMTETYIGYSDWTSALNLAGAIHGSLWAGKISLWTNWSFDGMQVSKNAPNSSFYVSKNYFKFIRPGAVQIDSKSDNSNLLVTAFENTDGKFAVVVINKGSRPVPARIYGNNLPERYRIYRTTMSENCADAGILNTGESTMIFPAGSVITLVAESNVLLTMNQVADTTVAKNSGETILSIEGITDGAGSTNDLTLDFENSNEGLFSIISVSGIGTDGKATIRFTPAGNQIGTAKIKLSLTGTEGKKRQVIFYVFVINPSSVNGLAQEPCKIYPNPASEHLNIEFSPNQFREVTITDIAGTLILRQTVSSDHVSINVKNWNKGIYIIKMTGDVSSKTERFVIE
ncbi:MAG: T9SS C-terminal target domain-containing protein [Porphyromonadaceae bacterium]|nr:MAG: T9SS C-terminal target domain-containing protein [Porphyromonadaceae bacterium]